MPRFLAEDYLQNAISSKSTRLNEMLTVYPQCFPTITLEEIPRQTHVKPWKNAPKMVAFDLIEAKKNPELKLLVEDFNIDSQDCFKLNKMEYYFTKDGLEQIVASSALNTPEESISYSPLDKASQNSYNSTISSFSSINPHDNDIKDEQLLLIEEVESSFESPFHATDSNPFSPQAVLSKLSPMYLVDPLQELKSLWKVVRKCESFKTKGVNNFSDCSLNLDCHVVRWIEHAVSDNFMDTLPLKHVNLMEQTRNTSFLKKENFDSNWRDQTDKDLRTATDLLSSNIPKQEKFGYSGKVELFDNLEARRSYLDELELEVLSANPIAISTEATNKSLSLEKFDLPISDKRFEVYCSLAKKQHKLIERYPTLDAKRFLGKSLLPEPFDDPVLKSFDSGAYIKGVKTTVKVEKELIMDRVAYLVWEVANHFPIAISRLRRFTRLEFLHKVTNRQSDPPHSLSEFEPLKSESLNQSSVFMQPLSPPPPPSKPKPNLDTSLNVALISGKNLISTNEDTNSKQDSEKIVHKEVNTNDPSTNVNQNLSVTNITEKNHFQLDESGTDFFDRINHFIKLRAASKEVKTSDTSTLPKEKRAFLNAVKSHKKNELPTENVDSTTKKVDAIPSHDSSILRGKVATKTNTLRQNDDANEEEKPYAKTIKVDITGKLLDFLLVFEELVQPLLKELKRRKLIPADKILSEYSPKLVQFLCWQHHKNIPSGVVVDEQDLINGFLLEILKQVVSTYYLIIRVSCLSALAFLQSSLSRALKAQVFKNYEVVCHHIHLLEQVAIKMKTSINENEKSTITSGIDCLLHPKLNALSSLVYKEAVEYKRGGEMKLFKVLIVCATKCSCLFASLHRAFSDRSSKHVKLRCVVADVAVPSLKNSDIEKALEMCDVLVIAEQMVSEEMMWKRFSHIIEFECKENSSWKLSCNEKKIRYFQLKTVIPTTEDLQTTCELDTSHPPYCKNQRILIGFINISNFKDLFHLLETRYNLVIAERTLTNATSHQTDGNSMIIVNQNCCILLEKFVDLCKVEIVKTLMFRLSELQRKFVHCSFIMYSEDANVDKTCTNSSQISVNLGRLVASLKQFESKSLKVELSCCFGSENLAEAIYAIIQRHPEVNAERDNISRLNITVDETQEESFWLKFPCINSYVANYILSTSSIDRVLAMSKEDLETNFSEINSRILQDFHVCLDNLRSSLKENKKLAAAHRQLQPPPYSLSIQQIGGELSVNDTSRYDTSENWAAEESSHPHQQSNHDEAVGSSNYLPSNQSPHPQTNNDDSSTSKHHEQATIFQESTENSFSERRTLNETDLCLSNVSRKLEDYLRDHPEFRSGPEEGKDESLKVDERWKQINITCSPSYDEYYEQMNEIMNDQYEEVNSFNNSRNYQQKPAIRNPPNSYSPMPTTMRREQSSNTTIQQLYSSMKDERLRSSSSGGHISYVRPVAHHHHSNDAIVPRGQRSDIVDERRMDGNYSVDERMNTSWRNRSSNPSTNNVLMTSSSKRRKLLTYEKVAGAKDGQTKLVFY